MSDGTWHDLHLARKYNQPFALLFHRVPLNNLIDLAFGLADWDPSSAPYPIIRGAQSSLHCLSLYICEELRNTVLHGHNNLLQRNKGIPTLLFVLHRREPAIASGTVTRKSRVLVCGKRRIMSPKTSSIYA